MADEETEIDRFGRGLRATVDRAIKEAAHRNSGTVEAEHFVLAVAAGSPRSTAATVLAAAGLDYDGMVGALRAERSAALAAAGVESPPDSQLIASPKPGRPRWGNSTREALRRAGHRRDRSHRRRMGEADVLIGILGADYGTVPRSLAIAGVDRAALITDLQAL